MFLEELLIKIGVDASKVAEIEKVVNKLQAGAKRIADAVNSIQKDTNKAVQETETSIGSAGNALNKTYSILSKLKLGIVGLIDIAVSSGQIIFSAFNNAIDKAKELATKKDLLFNISQKELQQAERYQQEMSKAGDAIDSVKTKIALNLAPAITDLIVDFQNWLTINKELIADGITKITQTVGKTIQVVGNFIKFIDKIITNTIGWENALIALGIAWAILNRAFLFSPIGIILGLLAALMLLIDDLMTYMNGGESIFGEYWQPFIDGAKAAWNFAKSFWEFIKDLWSGDTQKIKSLSQSLFDSVVNGFKSLIEKIKSFPSKAFKSILMFFGMFESEASKTVDRIGKIFNFIIDALTFPFRKSYKAICLIMCWLGSVVSKIVDIIGRVFYFIIDVLTFPFRKSYKAICQIMDWLGIDAGDVVNRIGAIFKAIFELLLAPFKSAWKLINDLFDIWEDDTTTITEKLGKTFWAILDFIITPFKAAWKFVNDLFDIWKDDITLITEKLGETLWSILDFIIAPFKSAWDFVKDLFNQWIGDSEDTVNKFAEKFLQIHESITAPFKNAIDWIKERFFGFIDTVKSKVKGVLSWIGLGEDDDKDIEVTTKRLTNTNIYGKLSTDGAKASGIMSANKNVNNNNAVTINNMMNVTTPQEGFDNVYNIVDNTARRINDNTQTALGSN